MPASFPFSKCVPKLHNSKRDRLNFNWGRVFFQKTPSPIEIVLIVLFIFPRPPYLCLEQICLCLNMEVSTLQFCKASYDCKSQTGALGISGFITAYKTLGNLLWIECQFIFRNIFHLYYDFIFFSENIHKYPCMWHCVFGNVHDQVSKIRYVFCPSRTAVIFSSG